MLSFNTKLTNALLNESLFVDETQESVFIEIVGFLGDVIHDCGLQNLIPLLEETQEKLTHLDFNGIDIEYDLSEWRNYLTDHGHFTNLSNALNSFDKLIVKIQNKLEEAASGNPRPTQDKFAAALDIVNDVAYLWVEVQGNYNSFLNGDYDDGQLQYQTEFDTE